MATYNSLPINLEPQIAAILTATKGEDVRKAMADALHALSRESSGGDIVQMTWTGNSTTQPETCGIYGRRYGNAIHVWGRFYGAVSASSTTAIFTLPPALLNPALTDSASERVASVPRFVSALTGTAASGTIGTTSQLTQLKVAEDGAVYNLGRATSSTNYTSIDFWLDVEVYEVVS